VQVPFTYSLTDYVQWHLVGGVAFFPDTINNGGEFYGTFFNVGTGISLSPAERFSLFADVNLPLGPGGNSANQNGSIFRKAVFSAGLTYLHSPTVSIDLYTTNALGFTPATQLLTFIPNGNQFSFGLNLKYAPDIGQNYAPSFRKKPTVPLTSRDKQFLLNGITLTSADTLRMGMFSLSAGTGAGATFQAAYGMSDDAQLEFIGQQLDDTGEKFAGSTFKLGVAGKLRFLNQAQGDPFSLSLRGGFEEAKVGIFTAEAPLLYQLNSKIAFMFTPKAGFFRSTRIVGLGLGVNYQPIKGFQLIGELTPLLTGGSPVWAVGTRYLHPKLNLGLEVYGSNGIGTHDIGGLIGQSNGDASVGFNIFWLSGTKR
jgi:hypothetical protein